MTFRRARTDEQRSQRRRQILDTAAAMLTEMPVAKLSLNELSRRVGLAKANVLRYFESREAVLLDLLDTEVQDWITELQQLPTAGDGTARERGDQLADILATSMARRPVLCDLLGAQGAVLERNISTEVGIRHKHAARQSLRTLVEFVLRHLPELGNDGAAALVESTLLMSMSAWQCSRPSTAMLAVYASDPELAAMRIDFTELVRRTTAVTAAGLLARRGHGENAVRPA
ncbi:TetR family transcriptional regulator [Streptomyces sp. NBC_01201]|uniref:TetR family transcriptional regulator n=1 Tax=Streptomyces glycanivorans TaxID=3033808 RepID=A0ABY9JLF7_9ACTN|nr:MULTISPECIES: TetR family transcriptional regulator [unclassified Streptomyces]WSQ81290.1 TetR family transcriptional regulator [Streptomyces sp. NBC_01213]WLQ67945.1 TetR family transcriptional regulator [Streptomyces sp. Alt3]WSQ88620.1 TetR family transcriptional regulator [Streptomyces sp. NBC_01212]WSR05374.1 TetR family transcriptional regulator [Streptomyces sp. NBC_01208]WSR52016.1 TetR family transcriptional regulator [Streptomyces sp. NBC_01201]